MKGLQTVRALLQGIQQTRLKPGKHALAEVTSERHELQHALEVCEQKGEQFTLLLGMYA